MEEKRLNLNRPLLSLRRFPTTTSTKTDEGKKPRKSLSGPEPKSGPVRVRGTVPFIWKHSPGRSKTRAESHTQTCSPIIPKPPPGIVLNAERSVPKNIHEKQAVSLVGENAVEEKECPDSGDRGKVYAGARNTLQPTGVEPKEKRPMCAPLKKELCEFRDTVKDNSDQVCYRRKSRNLEGSSLYRRLQGRGKSLQENEFPQPVPFQQENFVNGRNGFTSTKRFNSFRVLTDQDADRESGSRIHGAEITAYVDFLHSPKSKSFSSDRRGLANSASRDLEITEGVTDEELILLTKRLNHADPNVPSSSCKSDQEVRREILKGIGHDQRISPTSNISANPELPNNGYVDFEDVQRLPKVGNVKIHRGIDSQLPILPPLPKSPSESWLRRTLSNMSSRDSSSRSHLGTRMNSLHLGIK